MEDEEQAELSEVKIEIDIAEEPPQYWMTDQQSQSKCEEIVYVDGWNSKWSVQCNSGTVYRFTGVGAATMA